jgi:hypothetical protein
MPTKASSIAKIWTATVTVPPSFRDGLQRGCARERAIGERTNDQTCYRPRAVFLHVCVRHWHRDRCRKLAHLKRGASAGRLYAVVTKPKPNFTRLDQGRPEIAILVDAMLRARASGSWSTSQEPTSEHWWADVLADPRARVFWRCLAAPKLTPTGIGAASAMSTQSTGANGNSRTPLCGGDRAVTGW